MARWVLWWLAVAACSVSGDGEAASEVLRLINSIHMEDPDQLPPDLLEDIDDLLSRCSDITFVRRQQVVNMTRKVKNIKETKTIITIYFRKQRTTFLALCQMSCYHNSRCNIPSPRPRIVLKYEMDEKQVKCLWSPTQWHSLVQCLLPYFDLTSLGELASVETQVSLCLFNLVWTAKDERYSAIDVFVFPGASLANGVK
ncbi:hypothetical protein MRB53_012422 [Persea americana]|uniref:Uncharacterized protein n=1 Tax=Persea americana TaxID=3435 RepID=A0ACC2LXM4_PERAE|nr:hypothetical protein MRB53_012422 [Persea americana]